MRDVPENDWQTTRVAPERQGSLDDADVSFLEAGGLDVGAADVPPEDRGGHALKRT
jgi:hypothetical protein